MAEPSAAALATVPAPAGNLDAVKRLVLHSVHSPHSRRAYEKALDDFLAWYQVELGGPLTKALVQEYRGWLEERGFAPATINVRLAAIRKLASEASDNGLIPPDLAAGIARVKGVRRLGVRAGNWLTRQQASLLLQTPDPETLKGKRDRAMLALLIGCGLRRSELVKLTVEMIQQRDGRWVVADLAGKGKRLRTVPVPAWVKMALDAWTAASGVAQGRLLRSINKGGRMWGEGISEKVVWLEVERYAAAAGLPRLAPHDLRRTCAKLCRASGGDLEQIQFLLGHASIQTTERYLGSRQNLAHAVNDRMGIHWE